MLYVMVFGIFVVGFEPPMAERVDRQLMTKKQCDTISDILSDHLQAAAKKEFFPLKVQIRYGCVPVGFEV